VQWSSFAAAGYHNDCDRPNHSFLAALPTISCNWSFRYNRAPLGDSHFVISTLTIGVPALEIRAMHSERTLFGFRLAAIALLIGALACTWRAQAQPTLLLASPPSGATGVSPTTTVVFTFSEAMDPDTVVVNFLSTLLVPPYYTNYDTILSWNAGTNILTCTPSPAFLSGAQVIWTVDGADLATGNYMDPTNGYFFTGSGGGGTGSGTNAITTFSVGKIHHYNQASAGAATLDPATPYGFSGVTALASNRTATTVTLTNPIASVLNLTHLPPPSAEIFLLASNFTSLSTFDSAFPAGNYSFFVQAATSNQTVVVYLPPTNSLPQPGAPHLTNYPAALVVNPAQPFVLGWDAFPGGTAADYIDVDIGTNYLSPEPGLPGALTGTARTITIPAGTLQPSTTYASRVGFFHFTSATNATYATVAYRATYTEFSLLTTSGLYLTNTVSTPVSFSFDVLCSTNQIVTVEYRTNLSSGIWQTLLITNSPGSRFKAVSPQAATNRFMFFRARNGL